MTPRWVLLATMLWAAVGAGAAAQTSSRRAQPDCPGERTTDTVRSIDEGGVIALASGLAARLSDVRLPDEEGGRAAALAALRTRIGETVVVTSGSPDRWGRVSARIQRGEPWRSWAQELVEAGYAIVDPGTANSVCEPELLALEDTARERRLGLWARQPALPARDVDALRAREGRFTLVEGRVLSVGERRSRTYLNLGRDYARLRGDGFETLVEQVHGPRPRGRGPARAPRSGARHD